MFTDTKRLLIVTAHPDDLETVCGGTVAMLAKRGVEIFQVLATSGNIGTHDTTTYTRESLAAARQAETLAAAEILGIKECIFLGRNDGELVADLELRADLALLYRRFQPDTLWTFDPWWHGQAHPDHQAAGRAALDAYMPAKMPLYHPEQLGEGIQTCQGLDKVYLFGGSSRDDFYVDVTDHWDLKMEATFKHHSQFGQHSEEARKWLETWGSDLGRKIGVRYAEAFARMEVW
jgi:LmbE family N-acetylglucosaminyl deacetylase